MGVSAQAGAIDETMMHSVRRHELGAKAKYYSARHDTMHSVRRHELGVQGKTSTLPEQIDAFRAET